MKLTVRDCLPKVLSTISVGSKRFIVHKVDRSVTGLIVQQQCVGPFQTPIADYATIANTHFVSKSLGAASPTSPVGPVGAVKALGERPLIGMTNNGSAAMVRMAIGEMLTNIIFGNVSHLSDIKISGNWMWAAQTPEARNRMYKAVKALSQVLIDLGCAIDGGKDSVSMSASAKNGEQVDAPDQFVACGYAPTNDFSKGVTPDFKQAGSTIIYIDLACGKKRIDGSCFRHAIEGAIEGAIGSQSETPNLEDSELFKRTFEVINQLLDQKLILSGHDISDGGLVTTVTEMCISSGLGARLDLTAVAKLSDSPIIEVLFAEELGLVIEISNDDVMDILSKNDIPYHTIGKTTVDPQLTIQCEDFTETFTLSDLVRWWELPSHICEKQQVSHVNFANAEYDQLIGAINSKESIERYRKLYAQPQLPLEKIEKDQTAKGPISVAILRCEGSNGDREMAAAFMAAAGMNTNIKVYDICMNDLINKRIKLDKFRGIAFVGGFSYADVMGAAKGWATVIKNTSHLRRQFDRFFKRTDTFSLGVCNGCQLMSELGWVDMKLGENDSGKFESRFVHVQVPDQETNCIFTRGMQGLTLGVWVAHGEGKFVPALNRNEGKFVPALNRNEGKFVPAADCGEEGFVKRHEQPFLNNSECQVCFQYVDVDENPTLKYPANPNGSFNAIAGVCSKNGRHLAMMPHPERCFMNWQLPVDSKNPLSPSNWMKLFVNALSH